ncbi:type II toxin-antitoxin system RelE/ParE family toxin [Candidatus Binatia bacterium]|nr:type II toxin-antitoxin system RelE/ParE family toxin [Candidatus Binatia bacterium]
MELKPAAARDLAALATRDRVRVSKRIDALAANPRPPGVEKLKGAENLWRVRVGDYRIVYTIQDNALLVLVVRVRHRRDAYRQ